MSDLFDKALSIVPGDIVSVTRGRGWKRAKVLKKLADNMLLIKFKDGSKHKVSADHVLTEEEGKNFRKSQGNTSVVRNGQVSVSETEVEDEDESLEDMDEDTVERTGRKSRFMKWI